MYVCNVYMYVCMYIYVCMFVNVYVCARMRMRVCVRAHTHTHTHTHTSILNKIKDQEYALFDCLKPSSLYIAGNCVKHTFVILKLQVF